MSEIEAKLPDTFSRELLAGSCQVVTDTTNPIRRTQFAAGIRELFGYLLTEFAPDDEVRSCAWFVQSENTTGITRMQRATYAAQGGLSDEFVENLGLDTGGLHREAIDAIQALHAAVHVRPETIERDQELVEEFVMQILHALEGLLASFAEVREAVAHEMEEQVYGRLPETFATESFEALDLLSQRGYEIDGLAGIESIRILEINSSKVVVEVSGEVPVTLHHGSKEDACSISHSFEYRLKYAAPVAQPRSLDLIEHHVDDSSWYE